MIMKKLIVLLASIFIVLFSITFIVFVPYYIMIYIDKYLFNIITNEHQTSDIWLAGLGIICALALAINFGVYIYKYLSYDD